MKPTSTPRNASSIELKRRRLFILAITSPLRQLQREANRRRHSGCLVPSSTLRGPTYLSDPG